IKEQGLTGEEYLFKGQNRAHLSARSVQEIIKKAANRGGLKDIHPHTLRHSFATHLIENGYSLLDVQALLGHAKPETSMVYVHAARKMLAVKSPLDEIL
ncbi:MAG: tyrosine-type recombinase/integrase, partial [Nanoarchaeota archaeon]